MAFKGTNTKAQKSYEATCPSCKHTGPTKCTRECGIVAGLSIAALYMLLGPIGACISCCVAPNLMVYRHDCTNCKAKISETEPCSN